MWLPMEWNSSCTRNLRNSIYRLVRGRLRGSLISIIFYSCIVHMAIYLFFSRLIIALLLCFQHYQRDIVRGVEGYIVTGSKQVEIGK